MNKDLPSSPAPESSVIMEYPATRRVNVIYVLVALFLVVIIIVGIAVFLKSKSASTYSTSSSDSTAADNIGGENRLTNSPDWVEYASIQGFGFSYPTELTVKETERGVSINKKDTSEGVYILSVTSVTGSLKEIVNTKNKESNGGEVQVINVGIHSGYMYKTTNANYYYFPLGTNNYLSIIANKPQEVGEEDVVRFISSLSLK